MIVISPGRLTSHFPIESIGTGPKGTLEKRDKVKAKAEMVLSFSKLTVNVVVYEA